MHLAELRFHHAMHHLQQARVLTGGLLYAMGDDLSDRACLDGCFENLAVECEAIARDELGLQSDRDAAITNPGQGE